MKVKRGKAFIMLMLLIITFPSFAYGDASPKPSLQIIVKGVQMQNYWLDLLVTDKSEHSWLDISDEERELVKRLAEYEDEEGFHPALLGGTRVPLSGKIKGIEGPNNTFIHSFSYIGTPEYFKMAILTEDNVLIISDLIHRRYFNSTIEYDLSGVDIQGDIILSAGSAKEIFPIGKISLGFILRLILTLAIEIGIALLFGFTLIKSGKVLVMTNILTQVLLNIGILWMNQIYGMFGALAIFMLMELFIIGFEAWVYARYLTEKTTARRIIYGIIANIASLIMGFWFNLKWL